MPETRQNLNFFFYSNLPENLFYITKSFILPKYFKSQIK